MTTAPYAADIYPHIQGRPRNLWAKIGAVFDLIKLKDLYQAQTLLDSIRYDLSMSEELFAVCLELLHRAKSVAGTADKINTPTDYLHHDSGVLRPNFPRQYASRKVPYPYPPHLALPPFPGPRNDYRFLEDAATCLAGKYVSHIQRIHVIYSPGSAHSPEKNLSSLGNLAFGGRLDITILAGERDLIAPATSLPGEGTVQIVQLGLLDASAEQVWKKASETADLVIFLHGDVILDETALLRASHLANVSDKLVQPVAEMPTEAASGTLFNAATLRKLVNGRFPFRDLHGFNIAVPSALLRSIGGPNPCFSSMELAAREFAYRMYNMGAYFAPLAVPKLQNISDANDHPQDSHLYTSLAPNHWDRKEDGIFEVPKVSVYIPAYNASKYIERAVESILYQDVQDLEVCIADDGSKDDTKQLLETLYSSEPRVRWVSNPNGGIGFASNQAIRMSNSLYIGQLDSDDCLKPGAVRRLMEHLDNHPEVACCYGSCERIDAKGNYIKDEYSWPVFSREKMMVTSIAHHFRMFRRQAWERTSHFREDIVNAVDYDIFLKMSEVGEFHHIDEKLYQRRWHGENTSNVNEGFQTSNTYRVQKETLERLGLLKKWDVHLPNPNEPRRVSYKLCDDRRMVMFWPDYSWSNPYQKLLYRDIRNSADVTAGDIDAALMAVDKLERPEQLTFHLHWLNFLLRDVKTEEEARQKAGGFLEKLKKLVWKGARVVWTIHNHLSHDMPFPDTEIWLSAEIAKVANALHLHSAESVAEVNEVFQLPEDKICILPHGSYIGAYPDFVTQKQARAQLGIAPDDDVILFSGLVRPYKGVEDLIKVVRDLLKTRPKLRLLVVGEKRFDPLSELSPVLTEAERSRIHFTERFVDDMEMQLYLRAPDFAVYPYKKILTSGSLYLSLSFALPTIIPEVGMTRDVMSRHNAGVLYDGGEEELSKAVQHLLSSKDSGQLPTIAKNAYKIAQKSTWPNMRDVL